MDRIWIREHSKFNSLTFHIKCLTSKMDEGQIINDDLAFICIYFVYGFSCFYLCLSILIFCKFQNASLTLTNCAFAFFLLCSPWKPLINRDYRSISQFFTRQLRPGVRTISTASCMVSPVDGTVLHFGLANGHQIEQVSFSTLFIHLSHSEFLLIFLHLLAHRSKV